MANFIPKRIRDLFDVSAAAPTDGQILAYDANAGTWENTPQTSAETKRRAWLPSATLGVIDETLPRNMAGGTSPVTSGTLRLNGGVVLRAGQQYTHITFFSTVALVTPTNQWFCFVGLDGTVLAKTLDDLTTPWAVTSFKTLAFSAPYVPTVDTPVYLGICVAAATAPTLNSQTAGNVGGQTPLMACNSTTGLTTPASLGATATIGANAAHGWGGVVGSPVPVKDPTRTSAVNAASIITISTPDSTGEVVEPCVEHIPGGWNGHEWWGLITGYHGSNPLVENPSLYYSDDGVTWTPAPGVAFPADPAPGTGNNADPELRLGPDGNLHGFYIKFNNPSTFTGVYHMVFSPAGGGNTTATGPTLLFQSLSSTEQVTGPVVLYDQPNTRWVMWYVDAGHPSSPYPLKRRTCAGSNPGGTWSAAVTCPTIGIPAGRSPWEKHIERYSGNELHMVTTLADNGTGGGNTTLHFAVSTDYGLTWVFNPTPLLSASASGWDNSVVYRGDLAITRDGGPGLYGLFYSGKSTPGVWRWGYTPIIYT